MIKKIFISTIFLLSFSMKAQETITTTPSTLDSLKQNKMEEKIITPQETNTTKKKK